jgi:uncharacterized protein YhbP (UPF0306 family)
VTRLDAIAALLKSQSTMALATVGEDGAARVTPLYYLADEELRLYWFSSAASAHSKSLLKNPAVAVAVYRPSEGWREIRGVQMRGVAAVVADRARRRTVAEAYAERFHLGRALRAGMARSRLYAFEPEWVRYIDNSRGFGRGFEAPVARLLR